MASSPLDLGFQLASKAKAAEKEQRYSDAARDYRACIQAFHQALETMAPGRSHDLIQKQCNSFAAAAERAQSLAATSIPLPLPPGADADPDAKPDIDTLSERLERLKASDTPPRRTSNGIYDCRFCPPRSHAGNQKERVPKEAESRVFLMTL